MRSICNTVTLGNVHVLQMNNKFNPNHLLSYIDIFWYFKWNPVKCQSMQSQDNLSYLVIWDDQLIYLWRLWLTILAFNHLQCDPRNWHIIRTVSVALMWRHCKVTPVNIWFNRSQWNFDGNSHAVIDENAFENAICKMAAMLSEPQCINPLAKLGCN